MTLLEQVQGVFEHAKAHPEEWHELIDFLSNEVLLGAIQSNKSLGSAVHASDVSAARRILHAVAMSVKLTQLED